MERHIWNKQMTFPKLCFRNNPNPKVNLIKRMSKPTANAKLFEQKSSTRCKLAKGFQFCAKKNNVFCIAIGHFDNRSFCKRQNVKYR